MARCRLHVFLPEDEDVPATDEQTADRREELREVFKQRFTRRDGPSVRSSGPEWVSEVFEDTDENTARIDAFENDCLSIYPDAKVLRTRQRRAVMDNVDHDYDDAIMLQITHALT